MKKSARESKSGYWREWVKMEELCCFGNILIAAIDLEFSGLRSCMARESQKNNRLIAENPLEMFSCLIYLLIY